MWAVPWVPSKTVSAALPLVCHGINGISFALLRFWACHTQLTCSVSEGQAGDKLERFRRDSLTQLSLCLVGDFFQKLERYITYIDLDESSVEHRIWHAQVFRGRIKANKFLDLFPLISTIYGKLARPLPQFCLVHIFFFQQEWQATACTSCRTRGSTQSSLRCMLQMWWFGTSSCKCKKGLSIDCIKLFERFDL